MDNYRCTCETNEWYGEPSGEDGFYCTHNELLDAAKNGSKDAFMELMNNAEDKDPRSKNNYSSLHYWAENGNRDMVEKLMTNKEWGICK